jgi:hypothetical protein
MKIYKFLFALSIAAFYAGCGDDDSSSASQEEESSSSRIASYKSSSSLSTRADITYNDTLELGDTVSLDFEIPKSKKDIDEESGYIYITDTTKSITLFLGEFVKGTRVNVHIMASGMSKDSIQISSETGDNLNTLYPVWNESKNDSVFSNYMIAGHEGKMLQNSFVVFNDGFYYMNVKAKFEKSSRIRTYVSADSAYFVYTGTEDTISMELTDTLRGIFTIGEGPSVVDVRMSGNEGVSVALNATGGSISKFELYEQDTNLVSKSDSVIDALLLPHDTTDWSLKIFPTKVISYLSGPYATFEIESVSRPLDKGEYFSNPDSIDVPGDTLVVVRPRNDQAKYYLYQEQYIWLADLEKGDSIDVYHFMEGYCDNQLSCPATCEILDSKRKVVQEISCLYGGSLKVTDKMKKGAFYLHYVRTGDIYPTDESQVLTLKAYIQQPGLFKEFSFFDEEEDEVYGEKSFRTKVGDTLRFDTFKFRTMPKVASTNVRWFLPCEDVPYIATAAYIANQDKCQDEQEIYASYLVVQDSAFGKTPHIIAQSLADPTARDTLNLSITEK